MLQGRGFRHAPNAAHLRSQPAFNLRKSSEGLLTTCVISRLRVHAQDRQPSRQFQFDADLMPLPIVRRFLGTITEHILRSQFGPNAVSYGRHLIRILQRKRPSSRDLRDVRQ